MQMLLKQFTGATGAMLGRVNDKMALVVVVWWWCYDGVYGGGGGGIPVKMLVMVVGHGAGDEMVVNDNGVIAMVTSD